MRKYAIILNLGEGADESGFIAYGRSGPAWIVASDPDQAADLFVSGKHPSVARSDIDGASFAVIEVETLSAPGVVSVESGASVALYRIQNAPRAERVAL